LYETWKVVNRRLVNRREVLFLVDHLIEVATVAVLDEELSR